MFCFIKVKGKQLKSMIKNEDDDEGNRTKDSFVWRKDNLFK